MKFACNSATITQLVTVIFCLVVCSSACFIRNCPVGGKRALSDVANVTPQRECLRCGPKLLGQCLGPNICCGYGIGCFMNTEETSFCRKEDDIPTPCAVEGEICGSDGQGKCVAEGVCCNDEKCTLDNQCDSEGLYKTHKRSDTRVNPELLSYIRRLVTEKEFVRRR